MMGARVGNTTRARADVDKTRRIGHAGMYRVHVGRDSRVLTMRTRRPDGADGWIDRRRRAPHARARDEGRRRRPRAIERTMDRVFPEALAPLKDADREMYDLIQLEKRRQIGGIELIASEISLGAGDGGPGIGADE